MKIPKIKISDSLKYAITSYVEGSVLIILIIGIAVVLFHREPQIIKTTGVVSKLETAMDEPPSQLYARVTLKNTNLDQFKTDLVTAQTMVINRKYTFFTKNNVIIYYTESK